MMDNCVTELLEASGLVLRKPPLCAACTNQHSPSLWVWGEEAGDSRTRPCLGIPPSIKPMTELSLLEYSQIAILHLAPQGSYAQDGYSVVLWQPKGSEELWASATCPQEDSVDREHCY